jgi:hypothetical protein
MARVAIPVVGKLVGVKIVIGFRHASHHEGELFDRVESLRSALGRRNLFCKRDKHFYAVQVSLEGAIEQLLRNLIGVFEYLARRRFAQILKCIPSYSLF